MKTIKDILIKYANYNKLAIQYGEKTITYKQLFLSVNKIKDTISKSVEDTQNIAIFVPNSIQYGVFYFVICFLNKVIVPINVQSKKYEILAIINYCDIKVVITNDFYLQQLKDILKNNNVTIISVNSNIDHINVISSKNNDKIIEKNIFKDTAIILPTSGTIDSPKYVMLSHSNLLFNVKANVKSLKINKNDRSLITLPMSFSYCNTAQFLSHLYVGATIIIIKTMFFPKLFFKIVEKENISNFMTVPSQAITLLDYKNKKISNNISSLKWISIGGAHISGDNMKKLMTMFNKIKFFKTYGLTEASPRVTTLEDKDIHQKTDSIGKPIGDIKLRIVDKDEKDVNVGEIGEIVIKGKNIMQGYYKQKKDKNEFDKAGWLHTGDLGLYDNEGYIYLKGRQKNIIISGGMNIYPEEVEEILKQHPLIQDAYVYGISNDLLGEIPVANVVKKSDDIDTQEIIDFCLTNLSSYKVPGQIYFVRTLSYTKNGKIIRSQCLC
ncbi:MAG: acyl--CoA ligase [Bacteroidetes bacterium]|nr:acyl--CoA ligase [Bacteroidota bacterium]